MGIPPGGTGNGGIPPKSTSRPVGGLSGVKFAPDAAVGGGNTGGGGAKSRAGETTIKDDHTLERLVQDTIQHEDQVHVPLSVRQ